MNKDDETYIDHEVRIRMNEVAINELKEIMRDVRTDIKEMSRHMNGQFILVMLTIITLFGGVILHGANLI